MIPRSLSPGVLEALAGVLEQGRLVAPVSAQKLRRHVPVALCGDAAAALAALAQGGMSGAQAAAAVLRLVAAERREVQRVMESTVTKPPPFSSPMDAAETWRAAPLGPAPGAS